MSTDINHNISARKDTHLDICINNNNIESDLKYLFPEIEFIHSALPEMHADEVDMSVDFLGTKISVPLLISCMTGGSDKGFEVNIELAKAAEESSIPIGMGSFRILLKKPEYFEHFNLKKYAPNVPVIGNIGIAQLKGESKQEILTITDDLGVDALAVHINVGQELFQPEGDRDFAGLKEHLSEFITLSNVPVIIKETGCGFDPSLIEYFKTIGVSIVDIAGAGGTNWISVERERQAAYMYSAAEQFADWGIPTAVSVFLHNSNPPLIASGGIRNGMDAVKAVAMGALCAGMAKPFIKGYKKNGKEEVISMIKGIQKVFEAVMVLTSSKTINDLRKVPLLFSDKFHAVAEQYKGLSSK